MKLKAVRGGNQRGISFASSDNILSKTAAISCGTHRVYSDLRGSEKVDEETIVIDSRLFDDLECTEGDMVTLSSVEESIPNAKELLMEVTSQSAESHKSVTDTLSEEIGDVKDELDGLIVQIGLKLQIPPRSVTLQIVEVTPLSSKTNIARLSWKELGKIRLRAFEEKEQPEPPDQPELSDIDDILDRLLVLEDRCDLLLDTKRNLSGSERKDSISLEHVEKRLNESLFRLESIFARISDIEKRLDKLVGGIKD